MVHFLSETFTIIYLFLAEVIIFVSEFRPLAVILKALNILWRKFHLSEFLREMLDTVLVVKLRLIRCRLLLLVYGIPIYSCEPRMGHDLLCVRCTGAQSRLRIFVQKFAANIPSVIAQKWEVKFWLTVLDVSEKLFLIFAIEWWLTAEHLINDSSERPPV